MHQYMANWDSLFKAPLKFEIVVSAMVDDEQWHTVRCATEISSWVRTMDEKEWHEHIDQRGYMHGNVFDMSERIYLMLALKFS